MSASLRSDVCAGWPAAGNGGAKWWPGSNAVAGETGMRQEVDSPVELQEEGYKYPKL